MTPDQMTWVSERAREARERASRLVGEAHQVQTRLVQQALRAVEDTPQPDAPEPDAYDLEAARAALGLRIDDCWERLDDAVFDLATVHGVPVEQLLFAVRRGAVAASGDQDAAASGTS